MMLSNVSFLILGIIAEQPINPYEINKILDYIQVKRWLPVAASSVYATIKTLAGKGLIAGTAKKEGNMPEKTVYTITESGKMSFQNDLVEHLGSGVLDSQLINIALFFVCHLDREQVLTLLGERMEKLLRKKVGIERQVQEIKKGKLVPEVNLVMVAGQGKRYGAEIEIVHELMEAVRRDLAWNHVLTNELSLFRQEGK